MKMKYNVTAECFCKINNSIYFPIRETNSLCFWDMDLMKVQTFQCVPDEHSNLTRLYGGICSFGNYLLLVPFNAEYIWLCDRTNCKWIPYSVDKFMSSNTNGKFMGCIRINEKIYLFGYKYKGILSFNTKSFALEEVLESRSCFWGQCVAVVGDTLYVGENQENVIYRIDTVRDTYESIIPKGIVSGFAGIKNQGDHIYMVPRVGNTIIRWDMKNNYEPIYIDAYYNDGKNHFNGLAVSDKTILLYSPADKSYLYCIDDNIGKVLDRKIKYAGCYDEDKFILFEEGKIYITNWYMENIDSIDLTVSNNIVREQAREFKFEDGKIVQESDFFNLSDFISNVNCGD